MYEYSRSGNPTRSCLEKCIASVENAKYGRFMWKLEYLKLSGRKVKLIEDLLAPPYFLQQLWSIEIITILFSQQALPLPLAWLLLQLSHTCCQVETTLSPWMTCMEAPTDTSVLWLQGIVQSCTWMFIVTYFMVFTYCRNKCVSSYTACSCIAVFNLCYNLCFSRMGYEIDFVNASDAKNVEAAMKPNTKMVWVESPTNPTMKLVDIAAVSAVVKKHGKSFLVVDNTFMSPYLQRPLDLGADIVMESVTKYINGHTDVIMGTVCTNR